MSVPLASFRKTEDRRKVRSLQAELVWSASTTAEQIELLTRLYTLQLEQTPDVYLQAHALPQIIATQVHVFRWYAPFLPSSGDVLDWGCRHAPDSALIQASGVGRLKLSGCDLHASERYAVFHEAAQLSFRQLHHVSRLPYPDASFDCVIGSGTLEHVAMDYESLKELHRVLKPGGRLIVTYLPNRFSYEEWWLRNWRKTGAHPRLYSRGEMRSTLLHTGFRPLQLRHQNRFDALAEVRSANSLLSASARFLQLHRFTSTLCLVAEKVLAMD